jgi:hypothetical protein
MNVNRKTVEAIDWVNVLLALHNTHTQGLCGASSYKLNQQYNHRFALLSKQIWSPNCLHSLDQAFPIPNKSEKCQIKKVKQHKNTE